MNSEWPRVKLADLCDSIAYGYTEAASSIPVGPRFLRITDIVGGTINWHEVPFCEVDEQTKDKYRLRHGDIVIARTGATTGVSAYINDPPEAIFASYLVRLKVGKDADPRFLSYFLKSPEFWAYMRGVLGDKSAQPNASAKTMTQVTLRRLPLREQRAIAAILGALDDKIELNCQMNQTLEAVAQALFKNWFVDFEPFRDQGMEDSPLGPIPRGWTHVRLGDFTWLDKGISYKGKFLSSDGSPMINLGCFLGHGEFSLRNLKYYCGDYKQRHVVYPGDIVLANTDITQKREVLGSPAIVPPIKSHSNYLFTHHVYAIRFAKDYQHWKPFIFFALLQSAFRERAIGFATGTTVLALPRDAILDYQFVNPGDTLINAFVDQLNPIFALKYANDEQAYTLTAIRDALLPKLLSGQIRVKDAEKFVERAV